MRGVVAADADDFARLDRSEKTHGRKRLGLANNTPLSPWGSDELLNMIAVKDAIVREFGVFAGSERNKSAKLHGMNCSSSVIYVRMRGITLANSPNNRADPSYGGGNQIEQDAKH